MELLQRALQAIRDCELEVRQLAHDALNVNNYGDLKALADLAEQLKRLRGDQTVVEEPLRQSERERDEANRAGRVHRNARAKSTYPLFFREDDRLVKVGWSTKDRAEYEHRTSKRVVEKMYEVMQSNFGHGRMFSVGALLPFEATEGASVPDYQVYLVIKWLHGAGLLQKYGRDGYRLTGSPNSALLAAAWEAIPAYQKQG